MQNNYAVNMVAGFIREIARAPHRIFNEVPIRFGSGETVVSVEKESHAVVATLVDCPIESHEELLAFVNATFKQLSGYRATLRFLGGTDLNQYADDHLHELTEHWQCKYDVVRTGYYSLEVFRCLPYKEGRKSEISQTADPQ
ncbi:hypothetical protein JA33_240 [Dickeya phage vB_DsoM_JA33]|uniref:Uncharacterized protein n=3 Tax=Salmondvirus JA11 TaxID=2734141 RepID=A0A384ZWK9_9CAUD|nr:hypothetical protein HOU32_gp239 [Dickeya phage vB_DsoM_JA11]AXG66643.1 hypothetical protein JA13_240 [Dickeya phage vB_DsoM_JA13]AXG67614.1 hypothetical protein JA33_240 [Dickeya phage vB_DsoM_JA33]AYD80044.1 hypothetical protein JA11_239 [Dickeya phage vB_DsoM_JA11]